MKEFKFKINDKREIVLCKHGISFQIKEFVYEDIPKDYCLIYSSDYGFSAYIEDMEVEEVSFTFDADHPLYQPLLHFLNGDSEIRINSDFMDEEDDDICYMSISIADKIIILSFINRKIYKRRNMDKFNIEIKNIEFDLRSKLDRKGTDIKARLHDFFSESINILTEDYNKIKSEECLDSKEKKLVKK